MFDDDFYVGIAVGAVAMFLVAFIAAVVLVNTSNEAGKKQCLIQTDAYDCKQMWVPTAIKIDGGL